MKTSLELYRDSLKEYNKFCNKKYITEETYGPSSTLLRLLELQAISVIKDEYPELNKYPFCNVKIDMNHIISYGGCSSDDFSYDFVITKIESMNACDKFNVENNKNIILYGNTFFIKNKKTIEVSYNSFIKVSPDVFIKNAVILLNEEVEKEIENVFKLEEESIPFSEYRNTKDFALLFNYGDNDFGGIIEECAKEFCDRYNYHLDGIDYTYHDKEVYGRNYDSLIDFQIKDLTEFENVDFIKEFFKTFLFSFDLMGNIGGYNRIHFQTFKDALENTQKTIEYLKLDEDYEVINLDGTKNTFKRFVVGTKEDILKELEKRGHKDEESDRPREFPVWNNGETLICYMKNGYLIYIIR